MTDPTLLQPGWCESTRRINGVSLHMVEARRPGDPLLLLLHGFPEFWWAWRHQITPLAAAGYHVVVPDMRGYNTSEVPEGVPEATLGSFDFAGLRAMMQNSARADTFEHGALDRYAEAWNHPGSLTAMLNYYRALRERKAGGEPARLAPPTLILWAENNVFLERHVAEAGLALCDDGRLEIVAGASHWLHIEEPECVNARVLAFLATGR